MKKRGRYRVLLMCKACDKVYNGTPLMDYNEAIRLYHNTLIQCKDVCKNEKCKEPLVPEIQDMEKPKNENSSSGK